jgi:hypothetical protein
MVRVAALLTSLAVVAGLYALRLVWLFYGSAAPSVKRHNIEAVAFIFSFLALVALFLRRPRGRAELSTDPGLRSNPWPSIGLILLAIVPMAGTLTIGPLSDDFVLREWALSGHYFGVSTPFARPVVLIIWRLAHMLGHESAILHTLALALHAVNVGLSLTIARRLGLGSRGAIAAAAVFAVWPTQVEALFWTAALFDVVMTSLVLSVVALTLDLHGRPRRAWLGVAALTALALFTKETAIACPVLCLACAGVAQTSARRQRALGAGAAAAIMALAYMVWRRAADLPLAGVAELSRYALKEQLSRTFASLILPFSAETLTAHRALATGIVALTLAAVIVLVTIHACRQRPIALFGLVWILATTMPTIGYMLIGDDLDGSRYLYLAAVGWGLFWGATLDAARPFRHVAAVALALVLVAALVERQARTHDWTHAAAERDRLLHDATLALAGHRCRSAEFTDLPLRYRGAQLFNNGFAEAYTLRNGSFTGDHACHVAWTVTGFVVEER